MLTCLRCINPARRERFTSRRSTQAGHYQLGPGQLLTFHLVRPASKGPGYCSLYQLPCPTPGFSGSIEAPRGGPRGGFPSTYFFSYQLARIVPISKFDGSSLAFVKWFLLWAYLGSAFVYLMGESHPKGQNTVFHSDTMFICLTE